MRIFLIYPGHAVSTRDVAVGYDNALQMLGHQVLRFNYENSIAYHEAALAHWAERNPNYVGSRHDMLKLAGYDTIVMAVDFVPDVVISICGLALDPSVYRLIGQNLGIPIATILTESPYLDWMQDKLCAMSTIVFANERNSVETLREHNPRTFYLPHSFDPTRHHPQEVDSKHQSDVFFCGSSYPEREALFDVVDWSDIDEKIVITRWKNDKIAGGLPNEELTYWYSGTKIALNPHRTIMGVDFNEEGEAEQKHIEKYDAWSLGPRTYEIAACGAFQLTDDSRGELREVFGDAVATYDGTPEDFEHKLRYYLSNRGQRREMADAARERVQECAFHRRAQEILLPKILQEVI